MYFFCLLWVPVFYFLRRSVTGESGGGSVWAIILGIITALARLFAGDLVDAGSFGLSRWVSGFVDIVALPVLAPLAVYALCIALSVFSGGADFTGFALLWLIPSAVLRLPGWSAVYSPLFLALVPLLWTALAAGLPFFITRALQTPRWYVIVPCALGVLAQPAAAVTAYWAFFSHQNFLGFTMFFAALAPMLVSLTLDFVRAR